jgi:hypothetical protein
MIPRYLPRELLEQLITAHSFGRFTPQVTAASSIWFEQ